MDVRVKLALDLQEIEKFLMGFKGNMFDMIEGVQQLAAEHVEFGDKAKAAYEAFLALWKEADADIPILKSARAEYARL